MSRKVFLAVVAVIIAVAAIGVASAGAKPIGVVNADPTPTGNGVTAQLLEEYGIVCVFQNGELKWCGCQCTGGPTCQNGVQTYIGTPPPYVPPSTTPTAPPPPTVEPPTEKANCNQGRGNGNEGCDPGNSNNNQDSNDEPGSRGGGNGNGKPK
jgi:hypothetical protein